MDYAKQKLSELIDGFDPESAGAANIFELQKELEGFVSSFRSQINSMLVIDGYDKLNSAISKYSSEAEVTGLSKAKLEKIDAKIAAKLNRPKKKRKRRVNILESRLMYKGSCGSGKRR